MEKAGFTITDLTLEQEKELETIQKVFFIVNFSQILIKNFVRS